MQAHAQYMYRLEKLEVAIKTRDDSIAAKEAENSALKQVLRPYVHSHTPLARCRLHTAARVHLRDGSVRMLTSSTQVAELAHALASAKSPQKTYSSTLATDGGGGSAMSAEVEKLREELEEAKAKLDEEKFSHSQTRQASQQHAAVRLMLLPLSRPFLSPTCLELFFV